MPELDRDGLAKEFDLEDPKNMPIIPPIEYGDDEDPDKIIRDNIDRANRILDKVEEELLGGNFSARLVEVASKMIDSVSSAVSQIQTTNYNSEYLQIRDRLVELKEREFEHNIHQIKSGGTVKNQNIIFTDRESVLKALKGNDNKLLEGSEKEGE